MGANSVKTKIVGTDDFWEAMYHPRFIRVNAHKGMIDGTEIITSTPPELVDGFIEAKVDEVKSLLAMGEGIVPRTLGWLCLSIPIVFIFGFLWICLKIMELSK